VAGETPILTKTGYHQIQSLQDQNVEVWNGSEWSSVVVKQTAPRRHLITVYFSNGRSLTCTPDHKFIVGDGPLKEVKRIPAQFLIPGMKLRQEEFPVVEGSGPFPHPYLHGALSAFGCFSDQGPIMDVMGPVLGSILSHPDMVTTEKGGKAFPDNMPAPYAVPINSSVFNKIQWLSGFLDARSFSGNQGIALLNINETLLQNVQLLLTTLNVRSIVNKGDTVKVPLPDGKSVSVYNYGLMIPWDGIRKLRTLGLIGRYRDGDIPTLETTLDLLVSDIVDIGRLSPTYCFTEEKNNAGIFNGILTGQCLEVIEFIVR
ncbi:Ribonucleoside-diphosphate reductase large subunit, partial [uncultured virus]